MKIVFLSYYSGIMPRGVEVFVNNLANRLVELGRDVTVYQAGEKISGSKYRTKRIIMPNNPTGQGYLVLLINQLHDFLKGGLFTLRVLRDIKEEVDIIVPTNNRLQAILVKLWSFRKKTKIVISGHGGPGLDERIALWTFPDVFVALTSIQKNWASQANPFVKLKLIPNGIDLSEFNKNIPPQKLNLKKPIVLCVAAMWPQMKRQHLLINAMQHVSNASLLLVGDGEGRSELEQLGRKKLPGRFQLRSVPHSQIPGIYSACNLFVYPTNPWESFGIVLLEAMATGLGVVATDDPIRREIIGDSGLFVDPTNPRLFAKVIEDALKKDWVSIPQQRAALFSWDKIALQYDQVFKSLCSQ